MESRVSYFKKNFADCIYSGETGELAVVHPICRSMTCMPKAKTIMNITSKARELYSRATAHSLHCGHLLIRGEIFYFPPKINYLDFEYYKTRPSSNRPENSVDDSQTRSSTSKAREFSGERRKISEPNFLFGEQFLCRSKNKNYNNKNKKKENHDEKNILMGLFMIGDGDDSKMRR